MSPVPGWFVAACWIAAIGLAICVGLQYAQPRLLAIYAACAIVTAALPSRRAAAAVGGAIGLAAALWAAWLVRGGAAFDLGDVAHARGAGAIALAGGSVLIASGLRAMWA